MRNRKTRTLAARFTLVIVAVVLGLGFLFTVLDAFLSYRKELVRARNAIQQIKESYAPLIVYSLWLTDYGLAETQLEDIVRFPYIERAEVHETGGRTMVYGGQPEAGSEADPIDLDYVFRGRTIHLGSLVLHIDTKAMRKTAIMEQVRSVLYYVILGLVTSFTLSILFRSMVGRRVMTLSNQLRADTPEHFHEPLGMTGRVTRRDEIAYLTDSVNRMRQDLKALLERKNLMIREIHHRIKNNLSSIDGLLYLQAHQSHNQEVERIIDEARNSLRSMTVLYDKLYRSDTDGTFSAREYLEPLAVEIHRNFLGREGIQIITDIQDFPADGEQMSVLGMVSNELITNSMKYAFPGQKTGTITITLSRENSGRIHYRYTDSGTGFDVEESMKKPGSFGIQLVKTLGSQMTGGDVEFDTREGFCVHISFNGKLR
ncbi:MAG: hypothetical protein JXB03_07140 [Spirochaetales bacterium]|nr:hypothetical protein [Spirochaetales bacterium]